MDHNNNGLHQDYPLSGRTGRAGRHPLYGRLWTSLHDPPPHFYGWVPACRDLAVNAGDAEEILGLEAGAADQCAVDIVDLHQLSGIRGLYRTAVEDAHALPGGTETGGESLPDKAMHLANIGRSRRQPCSDCPDRLVGDDGIF